jgi:hypothetical protein
MLKLLQKHHFQKNSNPFTSFFSTCNQTLQCLLKDVVHFLSIGLISNQFSCTHDILKIQ